MLDILYRTSEIIRTLYYHMGESDEADKALLKFTSNLTFVSEDEIMEELEKIRNEEYK